MCTLKLKHAFLHFPLSMLNCVCHVIPDRLGDGVVMVLVLEKRDAKERIFKLSIKGNLISYLKDSLVN